MAEKLDEFEFRTKGTHSKYAPYLDGSIWKLSLDDFPDLTSLDYARSAIFGRARARGLKVRSSLRDGYLVIQAYEPKASEKS